MIPLRDSTPSRRYPVVTVALIAINIYVYFSQFISTPWGLERIITQYALVPAFFTGRLQALSFLGLFYPPLVTSLFLHGSWFHVLSNMLYLWIFGDNIEDKLGHLPYLAFYLLTGIIANLAHIIAFPHSPVPLVGASGAIAGILGAYSISFPRARVTSIVFVFIFVTIKKIPAVFFLFFWFIIQVLNGVRSLGGMAGNVAWWAHIGGFLAGILLINLVGAKSKRGLN